MASMAAFCGTNAHADDWSGPYVGLDLTHVRGQDVGREQYLGESTLNGWQQHLSPAGTGLGLRAGYNHVLGDRWLVGIEGDYRAYRARDHVFQYEKGTGDDCDPASHCAFQTRLKHSWSVSARAGLLVSERLLLLATLGLAHVQVGRTIRDGFETPPVEHHFDTWQSGVQYGLGAEYRFNSRLSGTLHFRHADLGKRSLTSAAFGGTIEHHRLKQDEISLGVNWRY
jgi:opacity protein-like surface antigen